MRIMIRISWCAPLAVSIAAACIACSATSGGAALDAGTPEAGGAYADAAPADVSTPDVLVADAKGDAGPYVFAFSVTLNGVKVTFDRGQFGNDSGKLYLELQDGGDPACPSEKSPTPKHTLIVSGLEKSGTSNPIVTLVDFVGDVITTPKPTRTSSASTATIASASGTRIELDLTATFDSDGKGSGQVVAGYCASLDAQN